MALPFGYKSGLQLSWVDANTIGISAGTCRDSTNVADLALSTAWTKTNAAWAAATGNGSGHAAFAANTWYRVFIIAKAGGAEPDIFCYEASGSPLAHLPTDYVLYRRIGFILTNATGTPKQVVKFFQYTDVFLLDVPVQDVNVSNLSTTRTAYTVTAPPGCLWQGAWAGWGAAGAKQVLISSLDQADTVATTLYSLGGSAAAAAAWRWSFQPVIPDASSQIGARSNAASTSLVMVTFGWRDLFGAADL